jgi:hypothetical protein
MALPKTKKIGKKTYGLRKTTPSKRVGKKAVLVLRKKKTPARLVKDTTTTFGVYAGAKPKATVKKVKSPSKSKKQTHRDNFIW